mgnify:CR=1 FL=1
MFARATRMMSPKRHGLGLFLRTALSSLPKLGGPGTLEHDHLMLESALRANWGHKAPFLGALDRINDEYFEHRDASSESRLVNNSSNLTKVLPDILGMKPGAAEMLSDIVPKVKALFEAWTVEAARLLEDHLKASDSKAPPSEQEAIVQAYHKALMAYLSIVADNYNSSEADKILAASEAFQGFINHPLVKLSGTNILVEEAIEAIESGLHTNTAVKLKKIPMPHSEQFCGEKVTTPHTASRRVIKALLMR